MPSPFLRFSLGVVLAVLLALSCDGCRRKDDGKFVVGFSQMEHNNRWRLAQTASIKAEAAKRNYDLVVTDAQGQTARQVSDVEDLVARGVNLILLAPREYGGSPRLRGRVMGARASRECLRSDTAEGSGES